MKKVFYFILFVFCFVFSSNAQQEPDMLSIGLGMGLDYGGFGANAIFYPIEKVGVFVGGGYALAGTGYNAGVKVRFMPDSRFRPYVTGMYGYNAAVTVTNATGMNKLFYGLTIGGGIDLGKTTKRNYWSLGVLIPLRDNGAIDNYIDNNGIDLQTNFIPIAITVGYKIRLF